MEIALNSSVIRVRKYAKFFGRTRKTGLWVAPRERTRLVSNPGNARAIRKFLDFPTSNGKSRLGNFEHSGRNVLMPHLFERRDRQTRPILQQLAAPGHETWKGGSRQSHVHRRRMGRSSCFLKYRSRPWLTGFPACGVRWFGSGYSEPSKRNCACLPYPIDWKSLHQTAGCFSILSPPRPLREVSRWTQLDDQNRLRWASRRAWRGKGTIWGYFSRSTKWTCATTPPQERFGVTLHLRPHRHGSQQSATPTRCSRVCGRLVASKEARWRCRIPWSCDKCSRISCDLSTGPGECSTVKQVYDLFFFVSLLLRIHSSSISHFWAMLYCFSILNSAMTRLIFGKVAISLRSLSSCCFQTISRIPRARAQGWFLSFCKSMSIKESNFEVIRGFGLSNFELL